MPSIPLDIPAFTLGVKEELEKISKKKRCWEGYEPVPGKKPYSEDSCRPEGEEKKAFDIDGMPLNENILPNISSQAKWKYVRTPSGLKLSDGNLVYSFGIPEFSSEDSPVERLSDDNLTDFEKDMTSKGTAQIHRSSPDNIYMTLADGSQNPTFMLQHEKGKSWRYSPSKKFLEKLKSLESAQKEPNVSVDPSAVLDAAKDYEKTAQHGLMMGAVHGMDQEQLAESIKNIINKTKELGGAGLDFVHENPGTSMLGTYLASKALSNMRDREPGEEEPSELAHIARSALPVAALSAIKAQ